MTEPTLIQLSNIGKHYGSLTALNDVSVDLAAGQMLALLGHNGAGKTTLIKIILGILSPDSGTARIFNSAPGKKNHAIGYVPENVNFYPTLTGKETLLYFARLNGLSKKDANRVSDALLLEVKLQDAQNRSVKEYSKGMKQRLGLAQALLPSSSDGITYINPKLLILDEPTVGLDPIATAEFYQLLSSLQLDGCGVIICTHVLPGLENHIDSALILDHGKIIALGTIEELHTMANLPVVVKPIGLNGSIQADARFQSYLQQNGLLKVPFDEKLTVLNQLLGMPGLVDIQVSSPSLPEIYQHYVSASSIGANHAK